MNIAGDSFVSFLDLVSLFAIKRPRQMSDQYDMIVIGAGSGGLSMALGLHKLGLEVLLVDKSDQSIGGECLNNGCIPSKALIHASKIIGAASDAGRFGIDTIGKPDLKMVWQYVEQCKANIRAHENAEYFKNQGLDVILGEARFTGRKQVEVNGKQYQGKKITIATGSRPRKLEIPGVEQVQYFDNENIWDLKEIPTSMLFVGAGPINMELGQAFTRLGSKVTLVEQNETILSREDPEISKILLEQSRKLGMEFHFNRKIKQFVDKHTVILDSSLNLKFDVLMVGIGRQIDCTSLNPEVAGVTIDAAGAPVVDKYLRTTNKNILVIGDAAGGPQFSHAAEWQATLHISNLFSPFKSKINYSKFSRVTFTDPEVASFGLSENELKQKGINYQRLSLDLREDDRAIVSDYTYGKLILLTEKSRWPFGNSRLLGGTMIAPNAGEMIQEFTLAQSANLGIKALFDKVHAYPTGSRVNKIIVLNHYMKEIKPWMKKLASWWY